MSTLTDWLGSGGHPVTAELAQNRADICLKCPENKPDSALTEAVGDAIKNVLALKNKMNLRVNGEKRLHQCAICTCALRLKIWTPIEVIRKHMDAGEIQRYPAEWCWQIKEP